MPRRGDRALPAHAGNASRSSCTTRWRQGRPSLRAPRASMQSEQEQREWEPVAERSGEVGRAAQVQRQDAVQRLAAAHGKPVSAGWSAAMRLSQSATSAYSAITLAAGCRRAARRRAVWWSCPLGVEIGLPPRDEDDEDDHRGSQPGVDRRGT